MMGSKPKDQNLTRTCWRGPTLWLRLPALSQYKSLDKLGKGPVIAVEINHTPDNHEKVSNWLVFYSKTRIPMVYIYLYV